MANGNTSMKFHDGKKKINKVDGGKKKAKRQYHKKNICQKAGRKAKAMTNLDALKEKMKFDEKFKSCPHHDQATHIRHKAMFDGAKLEHKRLQTIVLKEVSELVEALEFYAGAANYWDQGATYFDVDKGERARQTLAKFKGER